MDNPYLNKFSQLHSNRIEQKDDGWETYKDKEMAADKNYSQFRDEWARKYAWAIPDKKAIEILVEHSPIVEIGAGTGYWAKLVDEEGGDIICYDIEPPSEDDQWYPVREGDHTDASQHPDRTLFLSWVSYSKDWGTKALDNYEGDTVIVIGEGSGGCTGNKEFHRRLESNWETEAIYYIPQWYGLHDYMRVYKR